VLNNDKLAIKATSREGKEMVGSLGIWLASVSLFA